MPLKFHRSNYHYTPNFCEENIWWLAKTLKEKDPTVEALYVLFFTNMHRNILMLNQNPAPRGQPIVWDYHVVLQLKNDGQEFILDFDTRLGFATKLTYYFKNSFPLQAKIPESYRVVVRSIPATDYTRYFYSDRKHMTGKVPESEFPDYPIIQPEKGISRIGLSTYWDINQTIPNSKTESIDQFLHNRN